MNKWVNIDRWTANHQTMINKCNVNNVEQGSRCLCCKAIICKCVFRCSVTGKQFIFHKEGNFSCKSSHLIYLITCADCGIQYVGQTTQPLHVRLNAHRSCTKRNPNTYLYKHFNELGHDFSKATIQIIDSVESDRSADLDRLENYWISVLCTAFPLGLNDRIEGVGNVSKLGSNEYPSLYFSVAINRRKRGHGRKKKVKRNFGLAANPFIINHDHSDEMLLSLNNLFGESSKLFYLRLRSLDKKVLSHIALRSSSSPTIITPILHSFIYTHKLDPNNAIQERESIIIPFKSKFIDTLSLHSIFYDTSITSLLPDVLRNRLPLKIFFQYNKPIGRKIMNYSSFLNNLGKDDLRNIINNDCSCSSSVFNCTELGHIVTGDINIITNDKLRSLMSYGAKFREPISQNSNETRDNIFASIDQFITSKANKYRVDQDSFKAWGDRVKQIVSNRIRYFVSNKSDVFDKGSSIFSDPEVASYIKNLHKEFIIVVADKASSNFVVICKKFYTLVLIAELGIDLQSLSCVGNTTYSFVSEDKMGVIRDTAIKLRDTFNINCGDANRRIPNIFWNPKLHKNPYKPRFIAGARKSISKELEGLMNKGMQVLKANFKRYCASIFRRTGLNFDWSINSSSEFLNKIKSLDIWSMRVYDFSTLYTNLNLQDVEASLFDLCNLLFNKQYKYICVRSSKAFFSCKKYNGFYCFDKELFKKAISFILNNTYVCFAGFILKQSKGIPMGGGCSSPIADLYLCSKEFMFMKALLKDKKFSLAKLLSNNSRYVDDVNVVNYKSFHDKAKEIYPMDLILERSGENDKDLAYLDVRITIQDDKISSSVYNKTESFGFPVVNFTFPESNIPIQLGYDVFYGQILRYSKIFSDVQGFIDKSASLFHTLEGRGYKYHALCKQFKRVFRKNFFAKHKYGFRNDQQAIDSLKKHLLRYPR